MKRVFIIILHFGNSAVTKTCINSILKYEKNYREIIIVDNSSNFIQKYSNKITIIKNSNNLGYGRGMNVGIRYALSKKATHIFLLNNDIRFTQPVLQSLIEVLDMNKKKGIVGPAIKFKRQGKTIYDLGGKINPLFGRTSHVEVEILLSKDHYKVDYISGCSMLIKKEVFETIGFFDEQFFLYYEDVDFCLRAKQRGYERVICSSVSVIHKLSSSIGKNSKVALYHQTKSALLFGKKYFHMRQIFHTLFILAQSIYISLKHPSYAKYIIKAFYD